MDETSVAEEVRAFYEGHPYPPPIDDLEKYRAWRDPQKRRAEFHLSWPSRTFGEDLSILVAGCGTSQAAKHAMRWPAARVMGIDFSETSVRCTEELKRKYQLDNLQVRQLPLERARELETSFDQIVCTGVLHHLPDPTTALREMHRVLKPGGKACFWDPLRHNPVINVYRRIAKEVRTEDEMPLHIGITKFVKSLFSETVYETFWLTTLWIFLRFYLIERVDPNKERYWKKIIAESARLEPTYRRLERLDRLVKKAPFMKRFAWNIAVVATK